MAANPEVDGVVELPMVTVVAPEPTPEPEPEPVQAPEPVIVNAKQRRARPPWLNTAVLGAAALIAAGTLGYTADAAAQQRNQAFDAYVGTAAQLAATNAQLTQAQQDAASKKVTADYVAMYVANTGIVETDYANLSACNSFGSCRSGSQQLLDDLQKFQSARSTATVPSALSASDASLGDALSAAIAADEEIISGMDTGSVNKFKDGFTKLDAAMLNVAKAEASLGNALK